MYVEELGTFPSASPVLRLMATLRSGEGVPCGFRATGNPGGPGHQWVKARYIDPNPAGWEIRKFTYENPWTRATIEQDRVFIPSKLRDNKFLGPEYVANLQMVGSDTLVRAWLEGDWTVIEGAPARRGVPTPVPEARPVFMSPRPRNCTFSRSSTSVAHRAR